MIEKNIFWFFNYIMINEYLIKVGFITKQLKTASYNNIVFICNSTNVHTSLLFKPKIYLITKKKLFEIQLVYMTLKSEKKALQF